MVCRSRTYCRQREVSELNRVTEKITMAAVLFLIAACFLKSDSGAEELMAKGDRADRIIAAMTNEEKAAQLFMVTPEALTGVGTVTAAGSQTAACYQEIPVGGLIYMQGNIQSYSQTQDMLKSMKAISLERIGLPVFMAADEEGGSVLRIGGRIEGIPCIQDMYSLGTGQEPQDAYDAGQTIAGYMKELGFNVDLAPVADVWTNPSNTVIGDRSFSSDPSIAAVMVGAEVRGLQENGISATLKHFPGHGDTAQDSHTGSAVSYKTAEELRNCELMPFRAGIDAGADFVMTGHISLPNVTGDDVPATLSHMITTELLREEMGYDGIIITDAMNMGAITGRWSSGDAAVRAILAGADIVLAPADFSTAYHAVLDAVSNGTISMERVDESLRRIISLKLEMLEGTGGTVRAETDEDDRFIEDSGIIEDLGIAEDSGIVEEPGIVQIEPGNLR